jgi:hypothetical protein
MADRSIGRVATRISHEICQPANDFVSGGIGAHG